VRQIRSAFGDSASEPAYVETLPKRGYRLMKPVESAGGSYDKLSIQRGDGTPRTLFHQGGHVFHPAGAPSARIRFRVEDGAVRGLEIRNPGLVVSAPRTAPAAGSAPALR
jgi:hypothetical protein